MMLSPLIQTYSIQNTLKPLAEKITLLLSLTEYPRQDDFSKLTQPADNLRTAVKNLTSEGLTICDSSSDTVFQKTMSTACAKCSQSAVTLTEEVKNLVKSTTSDGSSLSGTYDALQNILKWTLQILVSWDEFEVHKLVRIAQECHDRLRLVQAARSMRGLLVCYTGFTESMVQMLEAARLREKDMIDEQRRNLLGEALATIQKHLQPLCDTTIKVVRNPIFKDEKDELVELLSLAIKDVIVAVSGLDDCVTTIVSENGLLPVIYDNDDAKSSSTPLTSVTPDSDTNSTIDGEDDSMAINIVKGTQVVQGILTAPNATPSSFTPNPQLDVYIGAIMKNSKAVADISKDHYKAAIMEQREKMRGLRQTLGVYYSEFQSNPGSQELKKKLNHIADLLCESFLELDKLVAQSVADQVAETFVDTSAPIEDLIKAVVSSKVGIEPSSPTTDDSTGGNQEFFNEDEDSSHLEKNIKVFRRRSLKLSEVAVQATQGSIDRKRTKQVKIIAGELTDLTSPVVSTALKVKQDGAMGGVAEEELQDLGKQWGNKAQQLREAVDEIINPLEFTAATEANIVGEMTKCREAIKARNWPLLKAIAHSIAAKGRRLNEVGTVVLESTARDQVKKALIEESLEDLEKDIEVMLEIVESMSDDSDQSIESEFASSLQCILKDIHQIQRILPDTSISNSLPRSMKRPSLQIDKPTSTSTPISAAPPTFFADNLGRGGTGDGSPVLRKFNDNGPSPFPVAGVNKAIGRPDIQTTPTSLYRSLSPSDAWILSKEQSDSPSSTFAPTLTSTGPDDYSDRTTSPMQEPSVQDPVSRGVVNKRLGNVVQYPTSIEGLNVTSSLQKLTNQSDFSLASSPEKEDKFTTASHTPQFMSTYTQPLQEVLTAANEGDTSQLNDHVSTLNTRTNRLIQLADTAANTATDQDLASTLQQKSAHLSHLTPRIVSQAKVKADANKDNDIIKDSAHHQLPSTDKELELLVHQWTGHVRTLLDASQKANLPWSHTARRLVSSAKKRTGLNKEIECINGHAKRMVGVANSSIEAATIEDRIGSTSNLHHEQDPDTQDQISQIRDKIESIETLTPDFISSAQQVAMDTDNNKGEGPVTMEMEQLNLLSHEWATKASALMKGVDDITMGMSGPADSLLISAGAGDPALLDEQCHAIVELSESMLKIAQDSVLGCQDERIVETVIETAHALINVSNDLVKCAKNLGRVSNPAGAEEEQQIMIEQAEILRRDWSTKMHLLTAHIDDLTANVAGPLDRLVSVALQASRTEGMAKDHLLKQFEEKADFTKTQLDVVRSELIKVISSSPETNPVLQKCGLAVTFLVKVSPRAIEAAKVLSTDPSSAKLDHFSHLRRQWAAKAQSFKANLNSLDHEDGDSVNTDTLELAFHELLQGHKTIRRRSITPSALDGFRNKPKRDKDWLEQDTDGASNEISISDHNRGMFRSYSDDDLRPPMGPAPLPPENEEDDETPKTPVSKPSGYSEPATPQHDYPATPTSKVVLRNTPKSFTPDMRYKKHLSVGTLPSWDQRDREESFNNTSVMDASTSSIAVAARTLKDTADQFLEEGNPFISLAKTMSKQMFQMSQFARGRGGGEIQSKSEMIQTAKAIAANAEQIARYANIVGEQCNDERMKTSLQSASDMIPTLSTQLKIIASVKSCNPNDLSADIMLVKNAQNLMQAVIQTLQAAEAAYVKGLNPVDDSSADFDSAALAIQWKRKLYIQRTMENISAPMGPKGLRKLNKRNRYSTPSLAEMLTPNKP